MSLLLHQPLPGVGKAPESAGCVSYLPLLARFASRQLVRLGVADELFLDRVPLQFAAELVADVAQVAHRGRAMAHLGRADRDRFARFHAFDPVAPVVARRIGVELLLAGRLPEYVGGQGRLEISSRDFDRAGRPDKDAVGLAAVKHLDAAGVNEF
jgi:hypothetical protein